MAASLVSIGMDVLVVDRAYWEHVCAAPFQPVWTPARVRAVTQMSVRNLPDERRSKSRAVPQLAGKEHRTLRILKKLLAALSSDIPPLTKEDGVRQAMQTLHDAARQRVPATTPCTVWPHERREAASESSEEAEAEFQEQEKERQFQEAERQFQEEERQFEKQFLERERRFQEQELQLQQQFDDDNETADHHAKKKKMKKKQQRGDAGEEDDDRRQQSQLCAALECYGWRSIRQVGSSGRLARDLFGDTPDKPTPWGVCEVEEQGDCFFGSLRRGLQMAAHLDRPPTIESLRAILAADIAARSAADYQRLAHEYRLTVEERGGNERLYASFEIDDVQKLFSTKTTAALVKLAGRYDIEPLTAKQLLVRTLLMSEGARTNEEFYNQFSVVDLREELRRSRIKAMTAKQYLVGSLGSDQVAVAEERRARRDALIEHVQTPGHYATSLDIGIIARHFQGVHVLILNSLYGSRRLETKLEKLGGRVSDDEEPPERDDEAGVAALIKRQSLQFDLDRPINNVLSRPVLEEAKANAEHFVLLLQTPGHFELVVDGSSPRSLYRWNELPTGFREAMLRLAS